MKKRQFFFFLFIGFLVAGLISKFVDLDDLLPSKSDGYFLKLADLKKDFPAGSEFQELNNLILATGYEIVSCSNSTALEANQEMRCFYKRRCFEIGGFDVQRLRVSYDKNKKISSIEGGWGKTFHTKCTNGNKTISKKQ